MYRFSWILRVDVPILAVSTAAAPQGTVPTMEMLTKKRLFKPVGESFLLLALIGLLVSGCSTRQPIETPDALQEERRIAQLTREISALSPQIFTGEAERAAAIAVRYSQQLAQEYNLSKPPLFHNFLVQTGLRERGLCIHWTEDLQAKLKQQGFQSLEFHWAVANYEPMFRFEHSSVVVTPPGGRIDDGILLDPWRHSGELYWSKLDSDEGYEWFPREVIRQKKLERQARRQANGNL